MVQEQILQSQSDLDLPVYLIWMPVLREHTEEEIAGAMPKLFKKFHDPRFIHYWDGSNAVGQYFRQHLISDYTKSGAFWDGGEVVWDTFVIFGDQAQWSGAKEDLKGWGRTIMSAFEQLKNHIKDIKK